MLYHAIPYHIMPTHTLAYYVYHIKPYCTVLYHTVMCSPVYRKPVLCSSLLLDLIEDFCLEWTVFRISNYTNSICIRHRMANMEQVYVGVFHILKFGKSSVNNSESAKVVDY